jgi:D-alanyl-D-alanine carboxypeptidase
MNRRDFLKVLGVGIIAGGLAPTKILAQVAGSASIEPRENHDDYIKDYLHKVRNFNKPHKDDIFLNRSEYQLLQSSVERLMRLQRTVGHGNFQLLSLDKMLKFANSHSQVGQFPRAELDFLEMIFYQDPTLYGFFGEKPLKNISHKIPTSKVVKVPYTGSYLYTRRSLELYKKIKREVGDQAILTSGVRSVIKQCLLFLKKAYKSEGNLSLASRSLAPPGCSFHGIGDFDVGQVGFGAANFTARFAFTEVFRRLKDLGHINLRYPQDNMLGVRFEPWHIKVTS